MQFNGNNNLIENNEIYKITDINNTPYGCQMLNLLGNNNIVRGNTLSRLGSSSQCLGILLEWDLADENVIEQNTISDTGWDGKGALTIAGGDNNIIRNNTIHSASNRWYFIYPNNDGFTGWPCNEETEALSILPSNDPAAPDYVYFYEPRNCLSEGNQVYDNVYTRQ